MGSAGGASSTRPVKERETIDSEEFSQLTSLFHTSVFQVWLVLWKVPDNPKNTVHLHQGPHVPSAVLAR